MSARLRYTYGRGLGGLVMMAVVFGWIGQPWMAMAGTPQKALLDLPAMALSPADAEEVGLDGLVLGYSTLTANMETAGDFIESVPWGDAVADDVPFREANAERAYILYITEPEAWSLTIVSFVLEFDATRDARKGFDDVADAWLANETMVDVSGGNSIGVEHLLMEGDGVLYGEAQDRIGLLYRVDNLVVGIVSLERADESRATASMIEDLAALQVDRIEDVRDGNAPGLSGQMIRLQTPGHLWAYDLYLMQDGTAPSWLGSAMPMQSTYESFRMVDYYITSTMTAWDDDIAVTISIHLTTHQDEDAAQRLYRHQTAKNLDTTFTPLDFGDEAVAVSRTEDDGGDTVESYDVHVRLGTMTLMMHQAIRWYDGGSRDSGIEPAADEMNELAAMQVSCLEGAASCRHDVPVPDAMLLPDERGSQVPTAATLMPINARRDGIAA